MIRQMGVLRAVLPWLRRHESNREVEAEVVGGKG